MPLVDSCKRIARLIAINHGCEFRGQRYRSRHVKALGSPGARPRGVSASCTHRLDRAWTERAAQRRLKAMKQANSAARKCHENDVRAGVARRELLKLTGAGVALAAGSAPQHSVRKGSRHVQRRRQLLHERPGDLEKVTFKNQYRMNVAGQPVHAQGPRPQREAPGDRRRPPDGRGEGAEREPLRHEDGRAGLRRHVHRPALLGRERGSAAQRRLAGCLRRGLQRRGRFPGHAAVRRPRAHRRHRRLRQRRASSSARPRSTRA